MSTMTRSELARRKALWAERKADEASASADPWWLGNLRTYQNMASRFWSEHFTALRDAAGQTTETTCQDQ